MFKTIFYSEVVTGLKQPMIYIFLLVFTLIAAVAVGSDDLVIGSSVGDVYKNGPFVLSMYAAYLSVFGLLIATTYFNKAALRDYQNQFNEILFSTPLSKSAYFFGRFTGALILAVIPLLGIFIGVMLGTNIGLESGAIAAHQVGEFQPWSFLANFLIFILPNMFIAGAITFALASKWKNIMISFIAAILLISCFLISGVLLTNMENETTAALVDVFGVRAFQIDTKYLTSVEKNTTGAGFNGLVLLNRLIWILLSSSALVVAYVSFSSKTGEKNSRKKPKEETKTKLTLLKPAVAVTFDLHAHVGQFLSFLKLNSYGILRSNSLKIIFLFGAGALLANLFNGFEYYGLKSYPLTYKLLPLIQGISTVTGMIMLVFYSGELLWRDRVCKIAGVIDATPHHSLVWLLSKVLSLIVIAVSFHFTLIIVSIFYQLLNGYTNLEPELYLLDFIFSGLPLYITWSCLLVFIQVMFNHKYLAYFVSVTLLFLTELLIEILDIQSFMLNIGISPPTVYSDMNGFGAGLKATNWYSLYWLLFGFLALIIAGLMQNRGVVSGLKSRLKLILGQFSKSYAVTFTVVLVLFILTGSFIFYNTEVLNTYKSRGERKAERLNYELSFKQYENRVQPKIVDTRYEVAIFPNERKVSANSRLKMVNRSDKQIDSLHFTMNREVRDVTKAFAKWDKELLIPGGELVYNSEILGYRIYQLMEPLKPGDTIDITVNAVFDSKGFENKVSNLRVAENGTFIDFASVLPGIGYLDQHELGDPSDRIAYRLPAKIGVPKLIADCGESCVENYVSGHESDWVTAETIISTASDQVAIAPGSLVNSWQEAGRKYFHYQSDHVSLNYFSFMSARYEVARKKWNGVDIEVYYDKKHAYNIAMMLSAVERSLEYYTANYGPYHHKQARIIEFPGYFLFAEAFPGTMPYSESYGFVTNLAGKDNNIIDAVVAHEMAHQWWAHQVVGADMQGASMLSESLSEYSALMVMKNSLNDDLKMKEFLKYDIDNYLKGRSAETRVELPLYKVEEQGYIHYGKGSVVLYALQDYIGEDLVNAALSEFLQKFSYSNPYPTTLDFLEILEEKVPDSLNYLLTDWFKEITLYDFRMKEASTEKQSNGSNKVSIEVEAYKIQVDSTGREVKVPFNDWVAVGVFENEGSMPLYKKVYFDQTQMSFDFEIDFEPVKVVVDPKRLLIEKVVSDNVLNITSGD